MKVCKFAAVLLAVGAFSTTALALPGDDCVTAVAVPGGLDPCLDTTPTGPIGGCTSGGSLNDVWMTFVATATSHRVRTDVSSLGTDSDYKVYSGTCGTLTEIGCSEDDAAAPNIYLGDICVGGLTPGSTYTIRLGGWGSEANPFSQPPGPFNPYLGSCGVYNVTIQADPGAVCGDGQISCNPGAEACDDGNVINGDHCSSLCQIELFCGDGILTPPEACDDGNNANGDGCSATCTIEVPAIPAVSEWGLLVLVLVGLTVGTVMFGRRREAIA